MFLINQEKKIPNMLGNPSLNQSYILRCVYFLTDTQISPCFTEYAGVDVAGTQTATGLGPDYSDRTDAFDKVSSRGFD